jgi:hypothetical protein
MLFGAGAAQATPNPKPGWEQSKLAEQAELEGCLTDTPDMSAQCWTKFNAALELIDAAAAKAGTSCRYVDNGDGTVSDRNTGLMWEKKTGTIGHFDSGDVRNVNNLFKWSTNDSGGTAPDGTAFTRFLGTLNNGFSTDGRTTTPITGCFASHCDWRLPSIEELQNIVDLSAPGCGSGSPCIDRIFGPTQSLSARSTTPGYYWSATACCGAGGSAWDVYFYNGLVYGDSKTHYFYVRAVRP